MKKINSTVFISFLLILFMYSFLFAQDSSQNNTIIPEMILIPSGEFNMGSYKGLKDERPVHKVSIDSFFIGKYEVTQKQWVALMGNNPSYFKGDNLPVEYVSWDNVQEYLKRLSQKTGEKYRLPTEAEWEYACRAGTGTKFSSGNDHTKIGRYAWFTGNSGGKSHPAGQKLPNSWGLYDMHGNVWEWCSDWYGEEYYRNSDIKNPKGPPGGLYRVVRGGSWISLEFFLRSSARYCAKPEYNTSYVTGFRCVREIE